MAQTKDEIRKYKRDWSKKYRIINPEFRKKQNEASAKNNAKKREGKVYKRLLDLSGSRFGKLVVLKLYEYSNRSSRWLCKCDCGNEIVVKRVYLMIGDTKSCGCIRKENPNSKKHGEALKYEYKSWAGIKSRCTNYKLKLSKNYVGRGIIMCDRWFNSYEAFLEDMGRAPSNRHTPDRFPNNNGNYEPGNVRWATAKQQANNRRNNLVLEHNGIRKTTMEWAEQLGIKYKRVHYLTKRKGLTIKDVIEIHGLRFST